VFFAPSEMDYLLDFYDLHGRKIVATKGTAVSGNNTITLDAHMLRDAYYLVHMQVGEKNLSRKVFVK